jgi:alpha-amylase
MAVLISNGNKGIKYMETGSPETSYVDVTKHIDGTVTTNMDGLGEFRCLEGPVSVWVPK